MTTANTSIGSENETHPVQVPHHPHEGARANTLVTLRAYEVYRHVFGEQEKMVTGECRGGFAAGELIGFLYAHSFPKEEWSKRVDEAF